jgi:hypothetical protein
MTYVTELYPLSDLVPPSDLGGAYRCFWSITRCCHSSFRLMLADVWFMTEVAVWHTLLRHRYFILHVLARLKCGAVFMRHTYGTAKARRAVGSQTGPRNT